MSAFADASIYGDEAPPPVSVKTVGSSEIELLDGAHSDHDSFRVGWRMT